MPEHRIRLRGAWDFTPNGGEPPRRVDLPVAWAPGDTGTPFCLTRKFGRPRFDPAAEAIALELAEVPGLRAIRLNGQRLELEAGGDGLARVEVGRALLDRNTLELDVDLGGLTHPKLDAPWGRIALVIAGRSGV